MKKILFFLILIASCLATTSAHTQTGTIHDSITLRTRINADVQPNMTGAITAYKMNNLLNGLLNVCAHRPVYGVQGVYNINDSTLALDTNFVQALSFFQQFFQEGVDSSYTDYYGDSIVTIAPKVVNDGDVVLVINPNADGIFSTEANNIMINVGGDSTQWTRVVPTSGLTITLGNDAIYKWNGSQWKLQHTYADTRGNKNKLNVHLGTNDAYNTTLRANARDWIKLKPGGELDFLNMVTGDSTYPYIMGINGVTGKATAIPSKPLNGVIVNNDTTAFNEDGYANVGTISGGTGGSGGNPDSLHSHLWSYYLDRANHTGTQLSSTISDFTSAVQTVGDVRYPQLAGSYANPAWITSLPWSKITGTPTTLSGYGITDAYTKTASDARYFQIANNLSEGAAATMRTNLGLGSFATLTNPATTNGDLIYYNGSSYSRLGMGTSKQTLHGGTIPQWLDTTAIGGGSGWSLTGNSGTSYPTNFLGTTDNIGLRFRTNNTERMLIDSLGRIGIGTSSPTSAITLDSVASLGTSGTGKGITLYQSVDQTTNYLRSRIYTDNTSLHIASEAGGTKTAGRIYFSNNAAYIDATGNLSAVQGNFSSTISGTTITATTKLTAPGMAPSSNQSFVVNGFYNASSGNTIMFGIGGRSGESGTAGQRGFVVGPRLIAFGSGPNSIAEIGTNTLEDLSGAQTNAIKVGTDYVTTFYRPIATSGSTPSYTLGAGAGTGSSITFGSGSNDGTGNFTITTGTSPTAGGDVITITFSTALTNTPKAITLTQAGENAANDFTKIYVDLATASTTSFKIKNISTTALQASAPYKFYYTITQ